ncbi:MAG: hypothetical protein GY765_03180, partial [bacterium]|nr:hypothetical protein [bacterium]
HIISDGISVQVLIRDFTALYEKKQIPELRLQYKDYCHWLKSPEKAAELEQQEKYWLKQYATPVPRLNLPLDYPRPRLQSLEGEQYTFTLTPAQTANLKNKAQENGATLYIMLLAVTSIFLARTGASDDNVVGTPVAGRKHADLEHIIGMFVNTLALRNYPGASRRFDDFLDDVKERAIAAFENTEYP